MTMKTFLAVAFLFAVAAIANGQDNETVTTESTTTTTAATTTTTVPTTTTTTIPTTTTPPLPNYKVTSLVHPPFLMKDGRKYTGFIPELMEKLAEKMSVTFDLQLVKDGHYGMADNNTWNGMIGEILNDEVDIAGAALTVTPNREAAVSFTESFMSGGITPVIGARPTPAKPVIFLILKPFTVGTWFLLIFAFLLFCICMFGIHMLNPYEARQAFGRGQCSEREANEFQPLSTLWFGFSTLMWQGYGRVPRSLAGRILIAFWFFFVLCVLILYTAAMVAIYPGATAPTPIPDYKTLEELYNANKEFVVIEGGSTEHFFRTSTIPMYKNMFMDMGVVDTVQDGIIGAASGEFVFLAENNMVAYHIQQDPCMLKPIGDHLNTLSYALATKKGSEIYDSLNEALTSLKADGYVDLLIKKWWKKAGPCFEHINDLAVPAPGQSVRAATIGGPFILLVLGMLLAGCVTAVQYFLYNRSKMENKKETLVEAEEGMNETTQTLLGVITKDDKPEKPAEELKEITKEGEETPASERELEPEDKEEKIEEPKKE